METDEKDEEIELDLNELSAMLEGCAEEELDMDDLADFFIESEYEDDRDKEIEAQCRAYYEGMKLSLENGEYTTAFENAKKLRSKKYSAFMKEIDDCYTICADHAVLEALIYAAEKYTVRGDGILKPEAFPYLKKLSDLGYIWSFRYLGDCYYYGIGCERDLKKAEKSYFEGMLFESSAHCQSRFAGLHPGMDEYEGDDLQKRIIAGFVSNNYKREDYAQCKMAELILDGMIKEYCRESAYVIFRDLLYSCDGIAAAKLGECILYGIGTDADPKVARQVLEGALYDLDWIVSDMDDEWMQEMISESCFTEKEYLDAYGSVNKLIAEADAMIKRLDDGMDNSERDALYDEDQMFELWLEEKKQFIVRAADINVK